MHKPKESKNELGASVLDTLNENSHTASKPRAIKDFAKAYNELVQTNFYDSSMVSKHDIEKAKKANQEHSLGDEVSARLWGCHDRHLLRIEEIRKVVEQERYLKGGHGYEMEDAECKFAPEVISRQEGEAYRTTQEFIQDQMTFLHNKNLKEKMKIQEANATAIHMPKAIEASNKMLEGKPQEEVFSRLSKKKPYEQRRGVDEPSTVHNASNVQIKMHRGAPISVALYDMNKAQI